VYSDGDRFEHCGFGEREIIRQTIDDTRGNDDEFCEGARATIVATRDTEDLTVVAKIYLSTAAKGTGAAENSGIEGDSITFRKIRYALAEGSDDSRGFMAHDNGRNAASGGAIVAVNVAATDATSGDANENFARTGLWLGKIGEFELMVLLEKKSFHAYLKFRSNREWRIL